MSHEPSRAILVASINPEDRAAVLEALLADLIEKADFRSGINESGHILGRMSGVIQEAQEDLDRAFVAENILDIFRKHPGLTGAEFSVGAEAEYDDQGGYYRCFSAHVQGDWAGDAEDDAGDDDSISDEISDQGWAQELHAAASNDFSSSNYSDANLHVSRATLEPFLVIASTEVSGKAVWAAIDAARQEDRQRSAPRPGE